jgi:hypothetical protein
MLSPSRPSFVLSKITCSVVYTKVVILSFSAAASLLILTLPSAMEPFHNCIRKRSFAVTASCIHTAAELRLLIAKEGESRLFQWLSDALQLSFSKEEKDKYINHSRSSASVMSPKVAT